MRKQGHFYSSEETISDADKSQSLTFGSPVFESTSHGLERENDVSAIRESTFPNSKCSLQFSNVQALESRRISDSEFCDSETGKNQILKDERLFMQASGGSSWTPISRRNLSSLSRDFSIIEKKESISVGEFINMFSETMSFSDNPHNQEPFLNCLTSTPKERRKSKSMSSLLNTENEEETLVMEKSTSLEFSTPKWTKNNNDTEDFHYYINTTVRKNIQRLREEENGDKRGKEWKKEWRHRGRDDKAEKAFSITCNGDWFVDPDVLILETKKGQRVRLTNNSFKNLKFKTTFDSRLIQVCPLSGTIPAMDEIGLRVLIAKCPRKVLPNSLKTEIKVIVGRSEKTIQVQFNVEEKSKFSKDRSYILS